MELDGSGAGTITVPPCFYAGSDITSGGTITAGATDIGTAKLTSGTMKVVAGSIAVNHVGDGEVVLYFDFDL